MNGWFAMSLFLAVAGGVFAVTEWAERRSHRGTLDEAVPFVDHARPDRPARGVSADAAVRWAERHYDDDPIRAMEIAQLATLDILGIPDPASNEEVQ